LTELAPDRLLWGFGVDDSVDFQLGKRLDVRWTTVLLEESEFDPSDQAGSRSAAAAAYREGRTLGHERPEWDPESEEPAPVPQVTAMELTAEGISIETSETDRVEWVSDAEVVGTSNVPGFGAPAAMLAIVAGSLLVFRRRN
jgi:PGF-CTERM protein